MKMKCPAVTAPCPPERRRCSVCISRSTLSSRLRRSTTGRPSAAPRRTRRRAISSGAAGSLLLRRQRIDRHEPVSGRPVGGCIAASGAASSSTVRTTSEQTFQHGHRSSARYSSSSAARWCSSLTRSVSSRPNSSMNAHDAEPERRRHPRASVGTTRRLRMHRAPDIHRPVDERHVGHAEERQRRPPASRIRARRTSAAAGRRRRSARAAAPSSAARPTATRRPRPCAPTAAR